MNQETRPSRESRPTTQPGYVHVPETNMTPGERRQRQISNLRRLLFIPEGPDSFFPPKRWSHSPIIVERRMYSLCLLLRAEATRSSLESRATMRNFRNPNIEFHP